ncbi:hypothetical protein [Catenulispora pinisilvae]|uniref:hypothetical protein n=1 Tax=Catenulispora pinisilvae TaxID=2705253 RepID=UPI00189171C4|nr:hypothetical protein [Catenulispora pinisilvae]
MSGQQLPDGADGDQAVVGDPAPVVGEEGEGRQGGGQGRDREPAGVDLCRDRGQSG